MRRCMYCSLVGSAAYVVDLANFVIAACGVPLPYVVLPLTLFDIFVGCAVSRWLFATGF